MHLLRSGFLGQEFVSTHRNCCQPRTKKCERFGERQACDAPSMLIWWTALGVPKKSAPIPDSIGGDDYKYLHITVHGSGVHIFSSGGASDAFDRSAYNPDGVITLDATVPAETSGRAAFIARLRAAISWLNIHHADAMLGLSRSMKARVWDVQDSCGYRTTW